MSDSNDRQILDEAYQRFHQTSPEYNDWLSNHGPMAVESLVHHGHAETVHPWIDEYRRVKQLEDFPRGSERITTETWRDALGDPRRLGDWPLWFEAELVEREWTEVLATWWPRLLPGLVASATHGVIRVGHAVRTLREHGANPQRLTELAHALGYWAARWQPLPGFHAPGGTLDPARAFPAVPRIPDQSGGIRDRLAQLTAMPGWSAAQAAARPAADPENFLRELVRSSVVDYLDIGHGDAIMLVHAATGPNAVLRVLPALPRDQWELSANYAWSVAAAVRAVYAPALAADASPNAARPTIDEVFDHAGQTRDAHAIKFADTAIDVHSWTGDQSALDAAMYASRLILGDG